jgi:hypothetical protein
MCGMPAASPRSDLGYLCWVCDQGCGTGTADVLFTAEQNVRGNGFGTGCALSMRLWLRVVGVELIQCGWRQASVQQAAYPDLHCMTWRSFGLGVPNILLLLHDSVCLVFKLVGHGLKTPYTC